MKLNVLIKPIKKYFKTWVKVIDEWAKIMPTTNWLTLLSTMLILWFGGQMVMDGTLTIGTLVAFNAYILMLAEPAQALTGLVNAGGEAAAGAQRVLEVLDVQPEIQSATDAVKLGTLRGEVEFRNVGLKYQNERTASLDEINLKVESNRLIALIGPTGSGKTSLVLNPAFLRCQRRRVVCRRARCPRSGIGDIAKTDRHCPADFAFVFRLDKKQYRIRQT